MTDSAPRTTETIEDELLALRCQLGEPAAFDALIARWHGPLWTFVRRLTGSDEAARETVQDVWVRVLRGIARLREPGRLRAWLFGIARRAVMDRLREQYAQPIIDTLDVTDVADHADALAGAAAVAGIAGHDASSDLEHYLDRLHHELSRLPVIEREVLTLFYLRELTLAQVADVLGVPIGTVKSRLFRARQLLRAALSAQGANV